MDHKLQLHEFFIEGGNREKSHVILHITEPSNEEEKKRGYFFAVCDLNNATTKHIVSFQNIVDDIEKEYYDTSNRTHATLEIILKDINRVHNDIIKDNIEVNCVVGTITEKDIEFSFCGYPQLLLFYKTKTDLYKQMNLIDQNSEESSDRLFGQLVQGKISTDDFVFIGTPNIKDFFTEDRLQKIVTSRPARQSSEHIGRVLSDIRNEQSFGGLIIHLQKLETAPTIKKIRPTFESGSDRSLKNLFSTEKNTSDTLAPSFIPQVNDRLQNFWQEKGKSSALSPKTTASSAEIGSAHLRQYKQSKSTEKQPSDTAKKIMLGIFNFLKFAAKITWIIILFIATALMSLGRFLGMLFFVITNMHNRRRQIMDNWRHQWQILKDYLKNLPPITKILFFASICIIIVIIGSIYYIRDQQTKVAAEKVAQNIIREIIAHKDAAESALIYKDENAAIVETTAAKQLQTTLDCKLYVRECTQFNEQIENILSQIRKLTVATPELLVDWSKNVSLKNAQLTRLNNRIVAYSSTIGTLYFYDLLTKTSKDISGEFSGFTAAVAPKENDYLALIYDNKNLAKYDPKDNSLQKAEISFLNNNIKIVDFLIYNRRVYSLDVLNNQIYKHDSIKTGFATGQPWIKDAGEKLQNALSLATDGDMFVGTADGQIVKYTKGEKQLFAINGLDPVLNSNAQIWTYTDKLYLYILDSVGKRLIILEKDGRLKNQITAKEWKAPSGMVIDEDNKIGYILDGGKLYKINL